jgi:Ca2+-binding RTX toxin-like protein
VYFGGVLQGTYEPTGRIIIFGYAGNDWIQVAGAVPNEVWMYGDADDDQLNLGNGGGLAIGGSGNDQINGGLGRDILIGGEGADRMVGNGGDDILIAGSTTHDDRFINGLHEDAWCHIIDEWLRTDATYQERITHLMSTQDDGENGLFSLNAATVLDDADVGCADSLTGSAGDDWYFYVAGEDKVTGMSSTEAQQDIDNLA